MRRYLRQLSAADRKYRKGERRKERTKSQKKKVWQAKKGLWEDQIAIIQLGFDKNTLSGIVEDVEDLSQAQTLHVYKKAAGVCFLLKAMVDGGMNGRFLDLSENIPIEMHRRFARKARDYVRSYAALAADVTIDAVHLSGCVTKRVQEKKKYRSHRGVAPQENEAGHVPGRLPWAKVKKRRLEQN